ncbi:hypothetical protein N9J80_01315 [Flavobacteriaceae bacterium]|nr:hypothetical protein [Flavobacteriaceae bacterium]
MDKYKINSKTLYVLATGLLIFFFVLFYFSDGIAKISKRSGNGYTPYSAILKGLFQTIILMYALITLKKSKVYFLFAMLLLTSCFLLGQFFLSLSFLEINFMQNINTLFKYLFPLILYLLAIDVIAYDRYPLQLFKVYRGVLTINSALILIGLFTGNKFLETYPGIYRFGFDGLILAQNEASFIFIFAITTVYYRRFYLKINELFFWTTVIPSLIVATKAVYLFIILLFVFHLVKRVSLKRLLIYGVSLLTFGYFLFSTFVNTILKNSYDVFIYGYNRGGLLYALLSGRDIYLKSKLEPLLFDHWSFPNLFFGGQDVIAHYIEMGLIDLFLFFGIIGFTIYLYIYYKLFDLLTFNKEFKMFFGLSLLIIIATAGHFFESGIVGVHFIFILLINRNQNKLIWKE